MAGLLAQPDPQQYPEAYSPAGSLETGRRCSVRRDDRGRRFDAGTQCPRRISADRRISPIGGFRNERSVIGIRYFLPRAETPPAGMASLITHDRAIRFLCL